MVSSTTNPVDNVRANRVKVLIEKSKKNIAPKAPIKETGIVTAGTIVARQSRRKTKITKITKLIAKNKVCQTSSIATSTNSE